MNLDLNAEPSDSPPLEMFTLESLMNEYERTEECLEHLRQLTSRARQLQRWIQGENAPRNSSLITNVSRETTSAVAQNDNGMSSGDLGAATQDSTPQPRNFSYGSHLVAKALGVDAKSKKASSADGRFFDCNICLNMARDPILTCCGHLFCWPCFYQLSYVHSGIKECPVCEGEVGDTSITPIYGTVDSPISHTSKLKQAGLKLPPRPLAHRIEHRKC